MAPGRLGVAAGALAALEAAYFGLSLRSLGFPDGHRTALDRWREVAYPVFIGLLVVGAVAAVRRRESRAVAVGVIAVGVACLAVDAVGVGRFDHGGGG